MTDSLVLAQVETEQRSFITKVYGWMSLALFVTAFVAFYVASTPSLIIPIVTNRILFMALIIGEILLVGYLVIAVKKMSAAAATAVFIGYSALNGLTLSVIFMIYTLSSISTTFFITASTFAVMSFYGFVTKRDLTSIGNLCFMGLVGIIIASIVNMFFFNETVYWITTYAGILIFVGLIAYDTQKIKAMNVLGNEGIEENRKEAIIGALALYLDFINLFLFILRIFGRKK
jgi:FtsH-binding integral membrane protein